MTLATTMDAATTQVLGGAVGFTGQWHRSLHQRQWRTLLAANLGCLFDGYESFALPLTLGVAFRRTLPASSYLAAPFYSGNDWQSVTGLGEQAGSARAETD